MNRSLAVLYGGVSYTAFLGVFLYAIAFVAGVGVPKHIDNGALAPWSTALAIDIALLGLFAVQHSGMARPAFKRWWMRFVPSAIERSTFVLVSSLVLALLFWLWRPLPQTIWHVDAALARGGLWGISLSGWLLVLTSSFTINHFELFGLRQVWWHARGRTAKDEPFVIRAMYRIVRHPLMLGFLIAFWVTPDMTVGHLLFAAVVTGYIVVAVRFLEERDLVAVHGDTYRDYQRRVPMLLPGRKRG
ncbi:Protein-S-isoprenylcysteine O-methyltransferase Ste14 [Pseudoxanthomonas sp. CF385]|uniref:methanethiol S-methyltransferase n=1 Tax=Pseudoxanthomonas sp. CF385 TaxID=1881042 RepID=UPI000889E696|nr:methanethiol S-methyltransferase [Pseudoxanthomonas sp. CF385]SDQ83910.1 Protein-S-isoprenylcysteine O-methyltransferase Ste14 [Pseudoxanthomonas sp. CF385]